MNPMIILGILLALSVLGNATLGKMYVGAQRGLAAETARFSAFKASVKTMGEKAQKDADDQKAADDKRKKDADAENAAAVARLNADIRRVRDERDRARGSLVPTAPAGSKCPPEQACFDAASLESSLRGRRDRIRGLADEGAALEADLNTARRWAQGVK